MQKMVSLSLEYDIIKRQKQEQGGLIQSIELTKK